MKDAGLEELLVTLMPELATLNEDLQTVLMFQQSILEAIQSDQAVDLDELELIKQRIQRILTASVRMQNTIEAATPHSARKPLM
jgi:hypothetical protein